MAESSDSPLDVLAKDAPGVFSEMGRCFPRGARLPPGAQGRSRRLLSRRRPCLAQPGGQSGEAGGPFFFVFNITWQMKWIVMNKLPKTHFSVFV